MVPRDQFPQIISHRGASGYVPEHSLQAYQLAIDLKTDYIEPDLCLSKDGYEFFQKMIIDCCSSTAPFLTVELHFSYSTAAFSLYCTTFCSTT